jgi:hypothetical protein
VVVTVAGASVSSGGGEEGGKGIRMGGDGQRQISCVRSAERAVRANIYVVALIRQAQYVSLT